MTDTIIVPGYRREEGDPALATREYGSTTNRAPDQPLVILPHTLTEVTGPAFGEDRVSSADADLTRRHVGEPLGERIIVHGRVVDSDGRGVPSTLVEVWQANAAGRYAHDGDHHDAPLDPNFTGAGRCLTDGDGHYSFTTIRPGAYPWRNHSNAWRPAHIHFSVFGRAFVQRLVTQMYFPGDPLFGQDPIFNAVRDERARRAMVSTFDLAGTVPEWALAFTFDIVLRGRDAVAFEGADDEDDD